MKHINILKTFTVLAGTVFLLNACEKTPVTAPIGDAGSTYMKILEAPERKLFFTPFSDVKTVDLFSIRKEPNSNQKLNTVAKAVLTSIPSLIDQYNTDNNTSFEELPDSLFTVKNASVVKTATGYDVNFEAGKFANELTIAMDGSKWDVSHTYALAFGLAASDGNVLYPNQDTVLVFLSVKNKYDGVYKLKLRSTGWGAYSIADGVTATYDKDFDFGTAGANSNTMFSNYRGDFLLPAFTSALAPTGFGATTPLFIFDNATNLLTDVQNTTPDDGRGRTLQINPAITDSRYDPDTKTIYAAFIMKQNGRPNQFFYDTLTYLRSR